MNTNLIVAAVVILIFLGIILFNYFYFPDWRVAIAPVEEQLVPSAKVVAPATTPATTPATATTEGLIEDVFNLKRPVKK